VFSGAASSENSGPVVVACFLASRAAVAGVEVMQVTSVRMRVGTVVLAVNEPCFCQSGNSKEEFAANRDGAHGRIRNSDSALLAVDNLCM
jgi:hypothetical protein